MKIYINKTEPMFQPGDVLSLSAGARQRKVDPENKENTLASLTPVRLDPVRHREFVRALHPPPHEGGPQTYSRQARYMVEVSAYIDAIFEGLRYGMAILPTYEGREKEVGDLISREIEHVYTTITDLDNVAKSYMASMSRGGHHIIRDSVRYKGGKDILYLGRIGVNTSPLANSGHPQNSSYVLPVHNDSYRQEQLKPTFGSKAGQAIINTGWWVQKLLLGEQSTQLKSTYARIFEQHPITTKPWPILQKLNSLFLTGPLAKAGIAVSLPVFRDPPKVIQETEAVQLKRDGTPVRTKIRKYEGLQEYVSMVVLREPKRFAVDSKVANADKPDESLGISMEAQALQPNINFSISLNIPKDFCEYISQTKDAQLPLISINTWATVWSASMLKPPKSRGGIPPGKIPKYVVQPSQSNELIKRRGELGLYTEKGRVNEDGLYITDNGDLSFLPTADDSDMTNAKAYEKLLEDAITLSFEAGTPLAAGDAGSLGAVFDLVSPKYKEEISKLKASLKKFKGSLQAFNWDINNIITVNATDPDRLVSTKLVGANRPDSLNIATYMRSTFAVGMQNMFSRTGDTRTQGGRGHIGFSHFDLAADGIVHSSIFRHFANFYNHFIEVGKVPTFDELVKKAAAELNIVSLEDAAVKVFEMSVTQPNKSIYTSFIAPDLTTSTTDGAGLTIVAVLAQALHDASGVMRTNLARECIKESLDPIDHERYFDGKTSQLGDFDRVYLYLGGQVFHQAVKAVLAIPRKDLMSLEGSENSPEGQLQFVPLAREVIPMCTMFGKYVTPEVREKFYTEADEIIENNLHPKASEDQLNMAGSRGLNADGSGGFKLFPHQAEALTLLKNHPKIAILDIAPGGGKTTIGVADISMLYADGLIKRPYVICPNRLVANWIEDCHKSFKGWNTIPITTETYGTWSDEKLTEMIQKAPPNTIVIIGNSFLSNLGRTQLVIGNAVEITSNSVEFLKKFEPDYVLIDESHRIKNTTSAIHRAVKTINQLSSVKYGRIATGTLIQNVLSDVVGQAAIYNGQIFRTTDEFDAKHKERILKPDGSFSDNPDYKEDTAKLVRDQLSKFCTVISYKRKEWAFMLPAPIETFVPVQFETGPDDDLGHKLRMFYEAVLKKTMDEAKADKKLRELMAGGPEDEDDNDFNGDDDEAGKKAPEVKDEDDDDDSDNSDELEAALQPYLQRLERLLTDPFGDVDLHDVATEIFGEEVDRESYVSPKVSAVIKRLQFHFAEQPWQKGKVYRAAEMCDFNGKSYIFKSTIAAGTGEEKSDESPDLDTEKWQEQVRGKVFITCRYTRSVDAIYRGLPPDLKKLAVRFHGEVDNKDDNLNKFKKDPKVQILIANEMGISEGHNLQMASRFIRVEAPWAPGELDQTASRIFRPDVGGEYIRQIIFLDWILCDGTLEVAKMGRLISKMLKKTAFDELHNPKYYKGLKTKDLTIIKMSLDNFKKYSNLDELCQVGGVGHSKEIHPNSYIGQYRYMLGETGAEFREMRKTKRTTMIPIEPTAMPESAKTIPFTPWVENMKVIDKDDDGLIPLTEALEDESSELAQSYKKDRKALNGQFVRCEFGLGTIVKTTTKKGKTSDDDNAAGGNEDNEVSKVYIKLAQGGEVRDLSASKVYLALKVTERNKNRLNKIAPKISVADKKRTEGARIKAEKAIEIAKQKAAASQKRTQGLVRPKTAPVPTKPEQDDGVIVELYPVVFNEFLALEAVEEDDTGGKALKKHGFRHFGHFAKLPIANVKSFNAALDWLEEKFTLDGKSVRHLSALAESFSTGKGRKFNIELAPVADLPRFFKMSHTPTVVKNKRRPELKVYPVLLSGKLMLVVDLATNPAFVARSGLTTNIPGMVGVKKFTQAPGSDLCFLPQKKQALIDKVKELMDSGIKVSNLKELKAEVKELNLKAMMTHVD